ncbi:hypothetical protein ABZ656_11605 [Streptomyces sp. NPDC007095]|uniref:hypothetical protein n=1 Tax=Streptomyces sp. NPDC007095 TaxID=3154482 RepID=UPI0033CBE49A
MSGIGNPGYQKLRNTELSIGPLRGLPALRTPPLHPLARTRNVVRQGRTVLAYRGCLRSSLAAVPAPIALLEPRRPLPAPPRGAIGLPLPEDPPDGAASFA